MKDDDLRFGAIQRLVIEEFTWFLGAIELLEYSFVHKLSVIDLIRGNNDKLY